MTSTKFNKSRFIRKKVTIEADTVTESPSNANSPIISTSPEQSDSYAKCAFVTPSSTYPSTFPSPKSTPPLISSGNSTLDSLALRTPQSLASSISLQSLVVLREDTGTRYASHFGRYFCGEGVVRGNAGLICARSNATASSSNDSASQLSHNPERVAWRKRLSKVLPFDYTYHKDKATKRASESGDAAPQEALKGSASNTSAGNTEPNPELSTIIKEKQDELKIAWQYRDMVERQIKRSVRFHESTRDVSQQQTVSCHDFDLSKGMQEELIDPLYGELKYFDLEEGVTLDELGESIRERLSESRRRVQAYEEWSRTGGEKNSTLEAPASPVMRILLESFGSNMYLGKNSLPRDTQLIRFLHRLKHQLRNSAAVCFVTLPATGISNALEQAIYSIADLVMDMYSFTGANIDVSQSYELVDYTGMLNIRKIPHFNTLSAHFFPDVLSYVYKLKKRKLYVEKLHLPPEETRTASDPNRLKFSGEEGKPKSILKTRSIGEDAGNEQQDSAEKVGKSVLKSALRSKKKSVGFSAPVGGVDKKDLDF